MIKKNYSHFYLFVTAHVHVHVPERVIPVHVLWLESQSLNYGCGNFWRLSNDLNKKMPPTYEIDSQHIFTPLKTLRIKFSSIPQLLQL